MTPKQTIAQAYDAIAGRDGTAFVKLLADDVVLTEAPGHPFPGVWEGKDAVVAALPGIARALRIQDLRVLQLLEEGDLVIGMIEVTCTTSSGRAVLVPVLEAWRVRQGKIVEITPYYHCTATLSQALAS